MFTRQTRHGIVEEGFLTIAIVGTFVIGILRTQTAIETFMAIGTCCKLIITHDDDDECSYYGAQTYSDSIIRWGSIIRISGWRSRDKILTRPFLKKYSSDMRIV